MVEQMTKEEKKALKPLRIWTKRDGDTWEGIEFDPVTRLFRYLGEDATAGFGFPVTEQFVSDTLAAAGRPYDRKKLPFEPREWDGTWNGTLKPIQPPTPAKPEVSRWPFFINLIAALAFCDVPLWGLHWSLGVIGFWVVLGAVEAAYGLWDEFIDALKLPQPPSSPAI